MKHILMVTAVTIAWLMSLSTFANDASVLKNFPFTQSTETQAAKALQQAEDVLKRTDALEKTANTMIGAIITVSSSTCPSGSMPANGQSITYSPYTKLRVIVGNNVPDLRGEFIRGVDAGRGVDVGRSLGSNQGHKTEGLFAKFENSGDQDFDLNIINTPNWSANEASWDGAGDGSAPQTKPVSKGLGIGKMNTGETRPRNIAMLYCIVHDKL